MSKKSKAGGKEKRLKEKRIRKATMQAKYKKFAELGQNTKSKRSVKGKRGRTARIQDHPHGKCGNPACNKCFDIHFGPFLIKGNPRGMPQHMFLKWRELNAQV